MMDSSFLWNNPPLAALHQMADMSSTNFLMFQQQQHQQQGGCKSDAHQSRDNSSSASPPLGLGTPHGIHDILTRKPPCSSASSPPPGLPSGKSPAAINSRMFFNPGLMIAAAAGNKHLQDLRSLYCWPAAMMAGNGHKNHMNSTGKGGKFI